MTRAEAKRRLLLTARMWPPDLALFGRQSPGCILMIALDSYPYEGAIQLAKRCGLDDSIALRAIGLAWDRCDAAEAIRLIKAL